MVLTITHSFFIIMTDDMYFLHFSFGKNRLVQSHVPFILMNFAYSRQADPLKRPFSPPNSA